MLHLSHSITDIAYRTYNFSHLKNFHNYFHRRLLFYMYMQFLSVYLYSIFISICCLFLVGSRSYKETLKSENVVDFNAHVVITLCISKMFSCELLHHMILTKLTFLYYLSSWIISPVLYTLRILNAQI